LKLILRTVLALSLGLNAFFICEDHYDTPDVDFYHTSRKNAYFVKKKVNDNYFVIEHEDPSEGKHRYLAKCQPTLTWEEGILNLGAPMSDSCIYLPSLVG
jgi:hypothetical protein